VPSANARWGNAVAVLTGDFLFARASEILAGLGAEAIRIQAQTFGRLVNGQRAETVGAQPGEDPFAHYFGVVTDKTASLYAAAGQFGGLLSGAPAGVTDRIRRACGAWGVAYQLSDDLLAGELAEPALHAEALGLLRAHPAMEMARADARRWAGTARDEILALPDIPARAAFEALCEFVVERTG
jgi:heptaprenyl diphosphate synthase